MTGSAFDAIAPEPSASPAGEKNLFNNVCRLLPSSGLQFLDAAIETRSLPMQRAWFTEDSIDHPTGRRRVLLPLSNDAGADGTIWHPVTFRPLGPSDTISFTGLEALEPFLDTWTPVPYLRYLGHSAAGTLRFDKGPSNWARVYIAKPAEGLRGADRVKAVFAFDTRLDARSRADQSPYLAPNADDALFASTFMLVDEPQELADFLSQAWVDAWIRESCRSSASAAGLGEVEEAGFALSHSHDERFSLAHIGRYLAFLRLLAQTSDPPQVRFVDSVSRAGRYATTAVDLVIEFGAADTTAVLIERDRPIPADLSEAMAHAVPLRLRDLGCPVTVHTGQIAATIEFDQQTFGNAALSRRSGRTDAFQWTSLVRVGREANRLSLRNNATDGITGLCDLASQLSNTEASGTVWRFSTPENGAAPRTAPMVTGETLKHLTETGDVMGSEGLQIRHGDEPAFAPSVRPRFSPSSLVGLYVVELLLHAIGSINAAGSGSPFAATGDDRNEIRQIERVIVMTALAMPAHERQGLIERVNGAIDLLWRTQAWDQPGVFGHPVMPQLSLGLGPDAGLQLVYLFNEVKTRLGGFSEFVDCVRRRTGEPDARDNIRVSSIEFGRRATGLTVIDYDVAHDGTVQAALVHTNRTPVGGERVSDAIIEYYILPAIERGLLDAGVTDSRHFLMDLLAPSDNDSQGLLGKRLFAKVLKPAASRVFELYGAMPRRGAEGLRRFKMGELVSAGGGRLDPVASQFNAAALAAGGRGFDLASVAFEIGRRQVQLLVKTELWPAISAMATTIQVSEADILIIAGELAQLPDLLDHMLSLSPVPAGRIVVLGPAPYGTRAADALQQCGTQHCAVLGAYLASRNLMETEGFSLVTRGLVRALGDNDPSAGGLARPQPLQALAKDTEPSSGRGHGAGSGRAGQVIIASGLEVSAGVAMGGPKPAGRVRS